MKIVITDDSITARLTIQKGLEGYLSSAGKKAEFLMAESGDRLLELLGSTDEIHLITLDVNMPGRDGLSLAGDVLNQKPLVPILVISANVQQSVQDRARQMGLHFLEKPLNPEKLAEKLQELGL